MSGIRGLAEHVGGRGGFTLLEVVVALTIMAVSTLSATRAFLTMLQASQAGGNLTVASSLAVRKLEEIRGGLESQQTSAGWLARFDAIANESPTPFPAPHDKYSSEVRVNEVNLTPSSAAPSWLTSAPSHADSLKWITVRVAFHGRMLAQVTSAVIRDMYRRP